MEINESSWILKFQVKTWKNLLVNSFLVLNLCANKYLF